MLRALEEDLRSSKAVSQAVNSSELLHAVSTHLQSSPLFAKALHDITAPDVEGCVPDKDVFSKLKAQGAEALKKQNNWHALRCYTGSYNTLQRGKKLGALVRVVPIYSSCCGCSLQAALAEGSSLRPGKEALRCLGVQDQQEASRIHCNRALALLKLSNQHELYHHHHHHHQQQQQQQQQRQQQQRQQPEKQSILEAAESEAFAAIWEDQSSFKAYYRRASCRQLLGRLEQGLEDCSQALHILAASSKANGSAAAEDEVRLLQRAIQQQLQEQQARRQQHRQQQQSSLGPGPAFPAAVPAAASGKGRPAGQQHGAAASSEPPAPKGGDCVQTLTGGMLSLERAGRERQMVALRHIPAGRLQVTNPKDSSRNDGLLAY
eukprot:scaffold139229_cov17-Tisochrysis_lutea.AAC.1